MKQLFRHGTLAILAACCAAPALADDSAAPSPAKRPATTVYRQVMPDGRIVYSDKVVKGSKLDETITVEQPIKGNLWTTESGPRPTIPPQVEPTPINRVNSVPAPGKKKTVEEATSDVIRAEMLLEDAKKRQRAGADSLAGERAGNPGSNASAPSDDARQKALAKEVAEAEAALKRAIAQRDALRNGQ